MAMTPSTALSLTQLKTNVGTALDNNDARYSDAIIAQAIADALLKLSEFVPYEYTTTLEADGTVELDGSDLLPVLLPIHPVVKAEYPDNTFSRVEIFGTTIELLDISAPASGESVTLYCRGIHSVDDEDSTLSSNLEPIVVKLAAGYAAIAKAQYYVVKASPGGRGVNSALKTWGESKVADAIRDLKGARKIDQRVFI